MYLCVIKSYDRNSCIIEGVLIGIFFEILQYIDVLSFYRSKMILDHPNCFLDG